MPKALRSAGSIVAVEVGSTASEMATIIQEHHPASVYAKLVSSDCLKQDQLPLPVCVVVVPVSRKLKVSRELALVVVPSESNERSPERQHGWWSKILRWLLHGGGLFQLLKNLLEFLQNVPILKLPKVLQHKDWSDVLLKLQDGKWLEALKTFVNITLNQLGTKFWESIIKRFKLIPVELSKKLLEVLTHNGWSNVLDRLLKNHWFEALSVFGESGLARQLYELLTDNMWSSVLKKLLEMVSSSNLSEQLLPVLRQLLKVLRHSSWLVMLGMVLAYLFWSLVRNRKQITANNDSKYSSIVEKKIDLDERIRFMKTVYVITSETSERTYFVALLSHLSLVIVLDAPDISKQEQQQEQQQPALAAAFVDSSNSNSSCCIF
ncbi:unnamed protein product [Pseudo-nitzschia multistriata]|uniref:Uncharacterized protein n=1 Tax=Pseudo-nitzschia multistriata TaxID=183589 RepID=A0A448ZC69_9STRA|nr:unnamed protein product [Pseudo-nitzschia multistriata]